MNNLEEDSRKKYSDSSVYDPRKIVTSLSDASGTFSSLLQTVKRQLLIQHSMGRRVLDLGCANGRHLSEIASHIRSGIGLDFSPPFIRLATETYKDVPNIKFALADVRALPLADSSIEFAFSFATLYHINDIEAVYAELSRVLTPNGVALLEIGNSLSLSTLVSRQYPAIAQHSRRRIGEHLGTLESHGFTIATWRSFQILPMWGDQPRWLAPLRHPALEKQIVRHFRGRMLDERISSWPGFRRLAFRHLIIATRGAGVVPN